MLEFSNSSSRALKPVEMVATDISTAADSGNKFEKATKAENFATVAEKEEKTQRDANLMRNPRDSMKSTWREGDKKDWTIHHHIIELLGLQPTDLKREVPTHAKTDKMPYLPHSEGHKWILFHALWPLVAHQLYIFATGNNLPIYIAVPFYVVAFHINAIHEIHQQRDLGHKYGFLDGDKHKRDQVPDAKVESVLSSLGTTAIARPMVTVLLAYSASKSPLETLTWWVPLEIGLYGVVLDFYYYWYHRILHESDTLWKYHRTHHLTKHPTVLLSLYADGVQEIFDIMGIPLLTYGTMRLMGLPMPFTDWWLCQQYIVWTELWGHSGLRILVTPPTTATPVLKFFDAELITEDHDLHHRKGWKSSHNYGKQTRLWDRLFGTTHERYESLDSNIDWHHPVSLPLW